VYNLKSNLFIMNQGAKTQLRSTKNQSIPGPSTSTLSLLASDSIS